MELAMIFIVLAVLALVLLAGVLIGRSVFPKIEQCYAIDEPSKQSKQKENNVKSEYDKEVSRRKNRVKNLGFCMAQFMRSVDNYNMSTNGREFEALGYTNMFITYDHSNDFATYVHKYKQKEMDELLDNHFYNFSSWGFSKKIFEERAETIIDLAKSIVNGYADYIEEKTKSKITEVKRESV